MKLSSILGTLALGLGLASATGIEQEATLKSALRGIEYVECKKLGLTDQRPVLVRLLFKHMSDPFSKAFLIFRNSNAVRCHFEYIRSRLGLIW